MSDDTMRRLIKAANDAYPTDFIVAMRKFLQEAKMTNSDQQDELYKAITKLAGPIDPVAETYEDGRRFTNLQNLIAALDKLIIDVDRVAQKNGRVEFSVKRAGRYAMDWLAFHGLYEKD